MISLIGPRCDGHEPGHYRPAAGAVISSAGDDDPGDRRVRLHRLVGGARPPRRRRATRRVRPRRRSVAPAHDRRRRRHRPRRRWCTATSPTARPSPRRARARRAAHRPPGRLAGAALPAGSGPRRADQRRRHRQRVRGGAGQRRAASSASSTRRRRRCSGHPALYPPGPLRDDAPHHPTTHYGVYKVANEATGAHVLGGAPRPLHRLPAAIGVRSGPRRRHDRHPHPGHEGRRARAAVRAALGRRAPTSSTSRTSRARSSAPPEPRSIARASTTCTAADHAGRRGEDDRDRLAGRQGAGHARRPADAVPDRARRHALPARAGPGTGRPRWSTACAGPSTSSPACTRTDGSTRASFRDGGTIGCGPPPGRTRPPSARIYNQGIEDRLATLETELRTADERRQWLSARGPRHPVIVADNGAGNFLEQATHGPKTGHGPGTHAAPVAWGSLNPFSTRDAYRFVADFSVYVERGGGARAWAVRSWPG